MYIYIYIFFHSSAFHIIDPNWRENLRKLGDTIRLSYGAGIVLKLGGVARLELNYCIPLCSQRTDR